jgi:hypothetical protein
LHLNERLFRLYDVVGSRLHNYFDSSLLKKIYQ